MEGFGVGFFVRALEKLAFGGFTCFFALVGACIGTITGALTGHKTETGFVSGAGIGAISGAVVSVDIFESLIAGDTLSKIAIFGSLLNGKIFREWVSPAMLKAYQWQTSTLESNDRETSDIFDVSVTRGVSLEFIKKLPEFSITCSISMELCGEICCAVCLQDFIKGENARTLLICRHLFHVQCIDRWLLRHGSCPICRRDV
ncbi:NEP1-interacting protein 1-like [Magnolia sinica]|uniref:NEP1-interacting protein 1-like n=1 Tax=Magnolia sinica TaxID=86752 RepID=UPI00265A6E2A|nr:NEP1-interacting protein 1-like [Magnolia sinica]